jgi:ABC-2 type transport system ATP-binding protein
MPPSIPSGADVIRIDEVSFAYRRQTLYQDFSLQLAEPGVYGVFGRNGSGKSTLLKLLAGLLFPGKGRIEVNGFEPRHRHPDLLSQVYIVPEEFHLPDLSPRQLADTQSVFYPRFSAGAFAEYLSVFDVPDGVRFGRMSLGQKKKSAIAFALATFTPVLLLDEPTNGLDIIGRDRFKDIVARPEHQSRQILISTHQAHDLERIMGHILFLDSARLALSATMAQLHDALAMGVARDVQALAEVGGLIYHESIGEQFAWVAARRGQSGGKVQLELLYKALSRDKPAVLAALEAAGREVAHV